MFLGRSVFPFAHDCNTYSFSNLAAMFAIRTHANSNPASLCLFCSANFSCLSLFKKEGPSEG